MKLRSKTSLFMFGCFGILLASLILVSRYSLMEGFARVENEDANNKALLITDAVHSMVDGLSAKSADWAVWDDAYEYVQNRNKKFEESNFADNALGNLKIDTLAFFDAKNNPIRLEMYDLDNEKKRPFVESLRPHFSPQSKLFQFENAEEVKTGILNLPEGFMIFAVRPVVDSEMSKPAKGTIFFGRFLSPKQVAKLSDLTHQQVTQFNFHSKELPSEVAWAKSQFPDVKKSETKALANVFQQKNLSGFALMYDFYEQPAVIYKTDIPRAIFNQGQKSLSALLWFIGLSVALIGGAIIFALDRWVLKRLAKMAYQIEKVDKNAKYRLTEDGHDEITALSVKINSMLNLIDQSTEQVKKTSQTISTMLNSVTQGFFLFNQQGQVDDTYSKACEKLFDDVPKGQHISTLFKVPKTDMDDWLDHLYSDVIDFQSMAELAPGQIQNGNGQHINLKYQPVRNEKNELVSVVCIASDVTKEVQAQQDLYSQKMFAERVTKIARNKNDFLNFVSDTRKIFIQNEKALLQSQPDMAAVYRYVHTIKGAAGAFSFEKLFAVAHEFENQIAERKNQNPMLASANSPSFVEKNLEMKECFESTLVEHANLLGESVKDGESRVEIPYSRLKEFYSLIEYAESHQKLKTRFMNDFVSQPVSKSFDYYNEVISHLAEKLGKEIAPIRYQNPDLMICHEPYRQLFNSLIHVFRNIADHGIESPIEREESGKNPQGEIAVNFFRVNHAQNPFLKIEIQDNGRGIQVEKIKAKLEEKGFETAGLTDQQLIQKIFESGFSTSDEVTETSGRGVGMDAVKTACLEMGGTCEIESVFGEGTKLVLMVPYIDYIHFENKQNLKAI